MSKELDLRSLRLPLRGSLTLTAGPGSTVHEAAREAQLLAYLTRSSVAVVHNCRRLCLEPGETIKHFLARWDKKFRPEAQGDH
jgi:hypothetical protein